MVIACSRFSRGHGCGWHCDGAGDRSQDKGSRERSLECAPAYLEYARALLSKAQAEADLMGSALKKEEQDTPTARSSAAGPSEPLGEKGEREKAADDEDKGEDEGEDEDEDEGEGE